MTSINTTASQQYDQATADANLSIFTETKLMKLYAVGEAFSAGGRLISITNRNGDVELFTNGWGDTVWSICPLPDSPTGYRFIDTGLKGSIFSASVTDSGDIILLASDGGSLVQYVVSSTNSWDLQRWGPPQILGLDLDPFSKNVAAIYSERIADRLCIAVLTSRTDHSAATSYNVHVSGPDLPTFLINTRGMVRSLQCVLAPVSGQPALLCIDESGMSGYQSSNGAPVGYRLISNEGFDTLSVSSATIDNIPQFFAVFADGDIRSFSATSTSAPYEITRLTNGMKFESVKAAIDEANNTHVFGLTTVSGANSDSRVYTTTQVNGEWTLPVPIQTNTALFTVNSNYHVARSNIELFTVSISQPGIRRLYRESDDGSWQRSTIDFESTVAINEFAAYSTEVKVIDGNGIPVPCAALTITSSASTQVSLGGAVSRIDADRPVCVRLNGSGSIIINQRTTKIGVPTLKIGFGWDILDGVHGEVGLRQTAGVEDVLSNVSAGDLLGTTPNPGKPLLPSQHANQATAEAIASAMRQAMMLSSSTAVSLNASEMPAFARRKGVGRVPTGRASALSQLTVPSNFRPWKLDFSGSLPEFTYLTTDAAEAAAAAERAKYNAVGGIADIFSDIGDFFESVFDEAVNVLSVVVRQVGNAVQATISFVLDQVSHAFDAVISTVESALDFAGTILAKVKVGIDEFLNWIGFVFDWEDILRTKEALKWTFEQFGQFIQQSTTATQGWIDSQFDTLRQGVDDGFNYLFNEIFGSTQSLGNYVSANTQHSSAFSAAFSNNFVLHSLLNVSRDEVRIDVLSTTAGSPYQTILDQITELGTRVAHLPEWNDALEFFKNIGSSPDNFLKNLLAGLLEIVKALVKTTLDTAQAVLDLMLGLLSDMVNSLRELVNKEIEIPFLSAFYRDKAGSNLTFADLGALCLAIPCNLLYKSLYKASPIPDNNSLALFKNEFTASVLLRNATQGLTAGNRFDLAPGPYAGLFQIFMAVGSSLCTAGYGIGTAVLDVLPPSPLPLPLPTFDPLSVEVILFEFFGLGFSCPWWFSSANPSCNTTPGVQAMLWIYGVIEMGVDIVFLLGTKIVPDASSDIGVGAVFVLGCIGGLVLAIPTVQNHVKLSDLEISAAAIIFGASILKPCRASGVVASTSSISLYAMPAIDGLCYVASAMCSLKDTINQYGPNLSHGVGLDVDDMNNALTYLPGSIPRYLM